MEKSQPYSRTLRPAPDPAEFQQIFLARIGGKQQFQQLFEHLPGV
jgi:hypothetical protein